ncbi:MAG: DUF123 domain-containing protein [Anaerolineales bacterium]|jgi:Uri superfamily endonuclease
MIDQRIPKTGGDYALLIRVVSPLQIQAGRLGVVDIPASWALYIGSAHGPGGLMARLARHARPAAQKRTHWHIDYLTAAVPLQEVWWLEDDRRHECRWAGLTAEIGQPIHSFGASDCKCNSHLISLGNLSLVQQVWDRMNRDCDNRLLRADFLKETSI